MKSRILKLLTFLSFGCLVVVGGLFSADLLTRKKYVITDDKGQTIGFVEENFTGTQVIRDKQEKLIGFIDSEQNAYNAFHQPVSSKKYLLDYLHGIK